MLGKYKLIALVEKNGYEGGFRQGKEALLEPERENAVGWRLPTARWCASRHAANKSKNPLT